MALRRGSNFPHRGRPLPPSPPHLRQQRPLCALVLENPARGHSRLAIPRRDLEAAVSACPSRPERWFLFHSGAVAGRLFFPHRPLALDALAYFWKRCLEAPPGFPYPRLLSNAGVQSDSEEERGRVSRVFADHARGLLACDAVLKVEGEVEEVSRKIADVTRSLQGMNSMQLFCELHDKRKTLEAEKELLMERLEEFKAAIRYILDQLEEQSEWSCANEQDGVAIFDFGGVLDWARVHRVMVRECRRLEEGLPIYAYRRKLLKSTYSNQVTVLIGETGCGKSTQLVQFLADSRLAACGSIVCTQPRKIAAVSLAQRVGNECDGCYLDNFVASYPIYSSAHKFNSKVTYMTDHCLLQHCMNDMTLAGISYIIVDEAHERSMSTDLALALIKKQLLQRFDLRLIIMSATVDACKLSEYFFGCETLHVAGRNFPVDIKYIPNVSQEVSWINITKQISGNVASYVLDVVRMVSIIHKTEEGGDILAFLTAQMEVEWACENFHNPSAVVLPLHGKLSGEEQCHIFQKYPGKRKVIFSTNLAETSLTIPGIKYVVDSGMVKESRFEAGSGMNVLKVCWVSQSSAKQRAGRAGRTGPGKCYRLYSDHDFISMPSHQEPEIRKVHLGIAVLRILALGIRNIKEFDFIDAPSPLAIDMAIQNLIQLGAVAYEAGLYALTHTGNQLVKLGIEPRLGKLILDCFDCGLSKEGVVLAALMANASSIFCRVGSENDKYKADCLKVPFCHRDGDLFTLLSVYKEWEHAQQNRNKWCWDNSINAKSMRRCHDTVQELESSLRHELNIDVPSFWKWNPNEHTYVNLMKKSILHSLPQNVAMYSGCERLGYVVALNGERLQLHPSCSLLMYGEKPCWVVFSEILSMTNQYLVCVTAVDYESIFTMLPSPLFDISEMENQKMQVFVTTGVGVRLLRRLCGKANHNLHSLVSYIRKECSGDDAEIIVDFENGVIQLFSSSKNIEAASHMLMHAVDFETRLLRNECIENYLFRGGPDVSSSLALLGAGGEIKHLELNKRCLTVEISHPSAHSLNDKELLMMIDKSVSSVAGFFKYVNARETQSSNKWGKVTFLSPTVAERAISELNGKQFCGAALEVSLVRALGGDHKFFPYNAVRAKVCWPRRCSKGVAFIRCLQQDTNFIAQDISCLSIGRRFVRSEVSKKFSDSVIVAGIEKEISEPEIYSALSRATKRRILDVRLLRGDAVDQPQVTACKEALLREIAPFMAAGGFPSHNCQVEVFHPEPKDPMMKAIITFDGNLHMEAAKALDHLHGKVLPGCLPWQKIECQQLFRSSVSCPPRVYYVIKNELDSVLKGLKHHAGVSCELGKNDNGSYRVKIIANATKTIANLRRPLEMLMKGKTISHASLTPVVLELLLSRDGVALMKSLEQVTGTCIMYDRQNWQLKIFGPEKNVDVAEERLIQSLLSYHENKPHNISLRGHDLPPDLMKEVVRFFGPDLHGLKEKVPEAELFLNTRRHILSVRGHNDQKQKVKDIVTDLVQTISTGKISTWSPEFTCPICLCELEEPYKLEGCKHDFCRNCLVEQCESAIKSHEGFPLCCTKEGCKVPFLLVDLQSLLSSDKLEELFHASLAAYVASSCGTYRFCPSPDCPSVYKVAEPGEVVTLFVCGACSVETCTKCHLEYHPLLSCELYKEFKEHPDSSLMEWRRGKEHVKGCPICGYTIEKIDGCNHISCKCGKHICWVCLECFENSDDCYSHLRLVHQAII